MTHSAGFGPARLLSGVATALLALGVGCSEQADVADLQEAGVVPEGGSAPAVEDEMASEAPSTTGDDSPLYVVSTRVRNPDSDTSYLIAVDSLSEQKDIDLSSSLEIPGTARAYGPPRTGTVYVTSDESGTMTEVAFDAQGAVTPGRVVSFTGLGIGATSGGNVNVFLSPTKAYHVNQGTLEVVVWNPQSMTLTGSFSTDLELSDAFPDLVFLQQPIVVGERLLLVSYRMDIDEITEGITTLTVIDTASDRVISNEADSRCSSFTSFALDTQGDLYFASGWTHAATYFIFGDSVPHPPCMLRIPAGETRFDPEWSRSLESELGTSIWAGVFPSASGLVLAQGLPESLVGTAQGTEELRLARPWSWYEVDPQGGVQSLEADATLEGPLAIAGPVDDEFYLRSYLPDLGTSTLVQTTARGGIRPGIEVPGQVATVLRVH